ncbi:hypothetical protein JQN72_16215 [Phycicoccus sp. CSK15P-2]|uniref:hypothetical protein n=1 Tax=Phycicoccus sp. CSK15P-2 TaxID=2807627 RepID=UPI00194DD221|nr:hypothetical protein [Phycicoccus sp. CSK15P-2]MBM6405789.1 hypothetical protein [Phycicoccus sp. CSK15P-2]
MTRQGRSSGWSGWRGYVRRKDWGPERWRPEQTALYVGYASIQMGLALLYVGYLLGSLVLTGGQVTPDGSPLWQEVYDYPVFTPGTALLVVPAAAGAGLAVPIALSAQAEDTVALGGLWGPTAAAAFCSLTFLVTTSPDDGGPHAGVSLGFTLAGLVVLVVATLRHLGENGRLRQDGLLPFD